MLYILWILAAHGMRITKWEQYFFFFVNKRNDIRWTCNELE